MRSWHGVNAASGFFGLLIVSLFEAIIKSLFVGVAKPLQTAGKSRGKRSAMSALTGSLSCFYNDLAIEWGYAAFQARTYSRGACSNMVQVGSGGE